MGNANLVDHFPQYQIEQADRSIAHVDRRFVPSRLSNAYVFLILLIISGQVSKSEALRILGDDPRSPLQALTSKTNGYWHVANIGTKLAVYELDKRHLSGNIEDDRNARFEARLRLTDRSYKQCRREINRLNRATEDYCAARTHQMDMGF
tara:strand:- start:917 stop:1366 length:450 start_codon:yes stop_codon:yes gene_type:complete